MKLVDEFRNPILAKKLLNKIHTSCTRHWKIMEVCGGQTNNIVRYGIDQLLPRTSVSSVELLHGPGCPVCVTPINMIDQIIELSLQHDFIVCTYSDMLRVPGTHLDLNQSKARGAQIYPLYSPLESLQIAAENPTKQIVLFAIGFETTAPTHAVTLLEAHRRQLKNFSLLVSHVLVPPALDFLSKNPNNRIDGFLAAGHVCAVQGLNEYHPLSQRYKKPIVATGFEPLDLIQGILLCLLQLESGAFQVENQYRRAINEDGNHIAQRLVRTVFTVSSQEWRGLGVIPDSGLSLRPEWAEYDAIRKFQITKVIPSSSALECLSGLIMQGLRKPMDCPHFGKTCTPSNPRGATMVTSEGSCAAYFKFRSPGVQNASM